jgi:uncharacterized protein (TIGR03083 family)
MTSDHRALMWAEVNDIGGLLHDLSTDEWDRDSLCDGWRVRDVIGHMSYGHTTPGPEITVTLIRYRGNVVKGSFELSKRFASSRTPDELVEFWDREMVTNRSRKGIAKVIRSNEAFLDHLVHHQDIRRPLGRPRAIPEERLVAALDLLPRIKTPLFATKPKVAGLRLVATDVDWTAGDGPVVEGPGEALIMAVAGRGEAMGELSGAGVPTLGERIAG